MKSYAELAPIIAGGGSIRMRDGEVVTTKKRLAEILNPSPDDVEGEDSEIIRLRAENAALKAATAKPESKAATAKPAKPADSGEGEGDGK